MAVAKPIKKLFIIFISFIPALILLSITNVIVAHLFVARIIIFPPEPKIASPPVEPEKPPVVKKAVKKKKEKEKKKVPPKVVTKTVYVPPTKEDLERIIEELETSDSLPPITTDDDSQRSAAHVLSFVSSTEKLLRQRDEELDAARKEIEELSEAFDSFAGRLEKDTSRDPRRWSDEVAEHFTGNLSFLKSILGRTSFKDLDVENMAKHLNVAMDDVRWLLSAEESDSFFRNVDNALLAALVEESSSEGANRTDSACHPSYLALDEGEHSAEFTPPPKPAVKRKKPKVKAAKPVKPPPKKAAPEISTDTARESHLYALVEDVKRALARRDLSSVRIEEGEALPDPIDEEGAEAIRSQIRPAANAARKARDILLAQEEEIREYWIRRMEDVLNGYISNYDEEGGLAAYLCTSAELVEAMMRGGLETFRRRNDLRSFLVNEVLRQASGSGDPDVVLVLEDLMKQVVVEDVFSENGGEGMNVVPPGGRSSWTMGRQSVAYAIDGPLLRQGVVGWIDRFVDAVSGYNDHVDALVDWAVGEEAVSVGTTAADAVSGIARKMPLPEEYAERLKKGGILTGRTRILLEG